MRDTRNTSQLIHKIPAFSQTPVQIWCLEVDPRVVNVSVHVQEEMNSCMGIIRNSREARLGDFFRINDETQIGPNQMTALEIRWGTITYDLHIQRFKTRRPDQKVVAFVSNGNLLFNEGFVAWIDGQLYHLRREPLDQRVYSSLIIWRDGHASIEEIRFQDGDIVMAESNLTITSQVACCTSGQRLVRHGNPVTRKDLSRMALDGQFTDLRHLLRFPALQQGALWSDIGLEQVANNPDLLAVALGGQERVPIEIDVPSTALEAALSEKGYDAGLGDYVIQGSTLWLRFKQGVYPHSMIGIRPDGSLLSVLVTGFSNRAGITVEGSATLLHRLGVTDGLLVDNGGDVMMQFSGEMVVPSSEQGRRELRSVILYTLPRAQLTNLSPESMGLKLVRYPAE